MKRIKLVVEDAYDVPEYQTEGSAGMDLCANNLEPIVILPGERKLIKTGIRIMIPIGYEAQIRPRSGMVLKHGITVLNSPGTIDSDYRGEIMVILYNASDKRYFVNTGDKVAQMILAKYERICFREVESLEETRRGIGGFGSTGT